MSEKHAYLIMAHHRMDLLLRLVNALDDERNDLYIHLDKKYKGNEVISAQFSKIIWIKRTDVRWGGYSQIRCELDLLKAALNRGMSYQYYHLLTGASYPIKPKEYIFDFFNKNDGFQFVGFSQSKEGYERVKNRFLFNELGKLENRFSHKIKIYIRKKAIKLQNILKIDYFKKYHMTFKKGLTYWSIKDDFAKYIVENEKLIHGILKNSLCGDEVFVQTLLFNSPYKNQIYNLDNEYLGCMVYAAWHNSAEEGAPNFVLRDFEKIKDTKELYGYKFEGKDGLLLLDRIDREILCPTVDA